MNSDKGIRLHPSIIIEQSVNVLVILFVLFIFAYDSTSYSIYIFLLIIVAIFVSYVIWKKTYIFFKDDELVIERNLLIKSKKTIPYHKIASINVERKVLNRIFGTSALKININSGVNALAPEAVLTFKEDLALKIRAELSNKLFDHEYSKEADDKIESLVHFTFKDIFIHSICGLPTGQSVVGLFFLLYALVSVFFQSSGGVIVPLLIFIITDIIPPIFGVVKYYNFRMYRQGDSIHIQHGMIQTYRSSFKITRINAVCIRQTLLSRLIKKASIELEVVGLSGSDGKKPTVCLLTNVNKIPSILDNLLPEFVYEHATMKQPPAAKYPILLGYSLVAIVAVIITTLSGYSLIDYLLAQERIVETEILMYIPVAISALIVLLLLTCAHLSYNVKEFDMGGNLFTFVNGIVDRETTIINYDRVQVINIASSRIAYHFGLAKCKISLLSSMGERTITSGYFPESELSKIAERIIERISTGEYDYRLNGI